MFKETWDYVYEPVLYGYRFYIYQKIIFITVLICKGSWGYVYQNVL